MPGIHGLQPARKCVCAEYDFAKDGGAVGDLVLRGNYVPKGARILLSKVFVEEAVTSGGAPTIALKTETAEDILAASLKAVFPLGATVDGVSDNTGAKAKTMTADRDVVMSIAVAPLTAGKFQVWIEYVQVSE